VTITNRSDKNTVDCDKFIGDRTEISLREWSDNDPVLYDDEIEYSFDFLMTDIDKCVGGSGELPYAWSMISQIHQTGLTTQMHPAFELTLRGNDPSFRELHIGRTTEASHPWYVPQHIVNISRDTWYSIKVEAKFSEDGYVRVYINGVKVYEDAEPTAYSLTSSMGVGSKLVNGKRVADVRVGLYESAGTTKYTLRLKNLNFMHI